MVEAIRRLQSLETPVLPDTESKSEDSECADEQSSAEKAATVRENREIAENAAKRKQEKLDEPRLSSPEVGNPISHGQVVELSKNAKLRGITPFTLDDLLRGSNVYVVPPKPKAEPVSLEHIVGNEDANVDNSDVRIQGFNGTSSTRRRNKSI